MAIRACVLVMMSRKQESELELGLILENGRGREGRSNHWVAFSPF